MLRGEGHKVALPRSKPGEACPLIGRAWHRQVLEDAYESLKGGRPSTVFLFGRTGTGKTTLIRAFLEDLMARGETLVLAGRCYEREWVPFKAFDSLIDALARAPQAAFSPEARGPAAPRRAVPGPGLPGAQGH